MAELKASVDLTLKDRFSGPAAKADDAATKLVRQIKVGGREIEALKRQQGALAGLQKLERRVSQSGNALSEAAAKTRKLRAEMRMTESPSRRLSGNFARAQPESSMLGRAHAEQRERLRRLRGDLREAGIETDRLGDAHAKLDRRMQAASCKVDRARGSYDTLAARRVRVARGTLFNRIGLGNAIAVGPLRFRPGPDGAHFLGVSHPASVARPVLLYYDAANVPD